MSYKFNPLREEYYKFERLGNEQLLYAENMNLTGTFLSMLNGNINRKRPKNIHIIIYGPTRDGKSYSAMAILKWLQTRIFTLYGETKQINVFPNESAFLDSVANAEFQSINMIDEQKNSQFQAGAVAEATHMQDFDEICAAKAIILIRLKPSEIITETAQFMLKTHGNDFERRQNKLLIKIREDGYERWLGHIEVPLDPILCEERKSGREGNCYTCRFFEAECPGCGKKGQPGACKSCSVEIGKGPCEEFIANYERTKLKQIDEVLQGGPQHRVKILINLAEDLSQDEEYREIKSKSGRLLLFRQIATNKERLEHATNRTLTEKELKMVVDYADELVRRTKDVVPKETKAE